MAGNVTSSPETTASTTQPATYTTSGEPTPPPSDDFITLNQGLLIILVCGVTVVIAIVAMVIVVCQFKKILDRLERLETKKSKSDFEITELKKPEIRTLSLPSNNETSDVTKQHLHAKSPRMNAEEDQNYLAPLPVPNYSGRPRDPGWNRPPARPPGNPHEEAPPPTPARNNRERRHDATRFYYNNDALEYDDVTDAPAWGNPPVHPTKSGKVPQRRPNQKYGNY